MVWSWFHSEYICDSIYVINNHIINDIRGNIVNQIMSRMQKSIVLALLYMWINML